MVDVEPDDGTDDQLSLPPFKFLLLPGIWSLCQARPFRFLDLPPELRNRVYEQAFTGSHGLSPHHLTQVNRQIAAESKPMFYAETHTLQFPLQTPKQMNCFLDWISDGSLNSPCRGQVYEFTFTNIDVGITTLRFIPVHHYPARVYEMIRMCSPDLSYQDATLWTWILLLGVNYRGLVHDFREVVMSQPPPMLFLEAIENGSMWEFCMMEFLGEREPSFPAASFYAQQFFLQFVPLLIEMANKDWSEKFLRKIAGFLFMRSMQAGAKVKREV